ncbi:zinc metallochaperone AztD [Mesorhizobium sp. 1B3]|uniref:zinc metallochaperone AztD n=1 Tax=Mesorhizobium sp. 1B3 TaxID=3243599 RepID=UPI003D967FB0
MLDISRATLCLGITLAATQALADENTTWRLFVADHAQPLVQAIDATTGKTLDRFEIKSPARLYSSESGSTVFAVQRDADVVSVISSGISLSDHGDHGDITIEGPRLLSSEIAGKKPVHFFDRKGEIAIFLDGEGAARIVTEKSMIEGTPDIREVTAPSPHHGFAAAFGDHVLVTEPHRDKPADELPIGLRVLDEAGATVGELHECPDLHGAAASGNLVAVACSSGLLIVRSGAQGPSFNFLPYGKDLPEGKSTTLVGGKGLQYFLGNYRPDAVVLVEPESEQPFRLIELPTRRVHFAVDPIRPKFAYVFTEDGKLSRVDVVAGKIAGTLQLTDPYSMDGHWNDPRPRIAVAGDKIAVTDPLKGVIHLVDAATFARSGEIAVEGKPYNVVAVGGSGEAH